VHEQGKKEEWSTDIVENGSDVGVFGALGIDRLSKEERRRARKS
jgi:hypothetical protein